MGSLDWIGFGAALRLARNNFALFLPGKTD
jgi:hypothetical protein